MSATATISLFAQAAKTFLKPETGKVALELLPGIGHGELEAINTLAGLFGEIHGIGNTPGGPSRANHDAQKGILNEVQRKSLHDTVTNLYRKLDWRQWHSLKEICTALDSGKISLSDLSGSVLEDVKKLQGHLSDIHTDLSSSVESATSSKPTANETQSQATELNAEIEKRVQAELKKRVAKNHEAGTEKSNQPEDDTECVLKNLIELINLKITKKNGHAFMFLKWGGPVLRFVGFDIPTPEELPGKVEKYITKNKEFRDNLKACIENRDVDTSKMSWFQSFVFSSCKKSLSVLGNHSEAVLEQAPQAAYAMKYASGSIIPRIKKIPFIGGILAMLYPFAIDELNTAGEARERELLQPILDRISKHHARPELAT